MGFDVKGLHRDRTRIYQLVPRQLGHEIPRTYSRNSHLEDEMVFFLDSDVFCRPFPFFDIYPRFADWMKLWHVFQTLTKVTPNRISLDTAICEGSCQTVRDFPP